MEIIKIFILLTVNYAICNKNDENAVVESVPKESRLQRKNIRFNEAYKPIIESFKRIRDDKVYDNRFQPSCILDKIIIERNYNSTQLKIKTIENDLESLKAYKSQFSTKIAENKTKIEMYSYKMAEELDQFDENEPKLSDNVLDIISAIKAVKDENGFLMTMISKFDEMEANLLDRLVIYKNYSRDLGQMMALLTMSGICGLLCLWFTVIKLNQNSVKNANKDLLDTFGILESILLVAMSLFLFMSIPI